MKLIVGIGNPGKEYINTRHNVGFIILDNYDPNFKWQTDKDAMIVKKTIHNENVIFLKPLTYVNLSGNAVQRIAHYYKIPNENILIIRDDLDLLSNTYKLKYNSSSGGHNGIKSIIDMLNSKEFLQLKVGIGNNKDNDPKDYVLSRLSENELNYLQSDIFREIIDYYIANNIQKTMNKYNTK